MGNEACLNIQTWEKNKSKILMTFVLITLLIFYFIFEFGLFVGIFVLYHISIFRIHRVVKKFYGDIITIPTNIPRGKIVE